MGSCCFRAFLNNFLVPWVDVILNASYEIKSYLLLNDFMDSNMMAMKSSFMNKIYELKNEISLLQSLNDRNESKEPENSHSINVLETKFVYLEKENSILSSELENKQKTIDSLLETNSSLFKSIRDLSSLVIQDSTSTDSKISNGIHKINRKKTVDYIKPSIRKKPGFLFVHSGTP